ncbi:MAG: hypothetical protein IJ002_02285 [Clostridia bacterium]|nr:hypothetical protein [Clostridia bacterium]
MKKTCEIRIGFCKFLFFWGSKLMFMLLLSPPEIATLTLKDDKGGFEQSAEKGLFYRTATTPTCHPRTERSEVKDLAGRCLLEL